MVPRGCGIAFPVLEEEPRHPHMRNVGGTDPARPDSGSQTGVEADALQQLQELIAAAHRGDPDSQSRLGDLYRTGDEHTKQDYTEALRWYRLAAEQGDPNAQNN